MRKSDKYIISGLSLLVGTSLLYLLVRKGRASKFERGKAK
jgi:hypothetical protein